MVSAGRPWSWFVALWGGLLLWVGCDSASPSLDPEPEPPPAITRTFNVATESACSEPDNRTFRRVAVSTRAEIWADTNNPPGGFTDEEYQEIAQEFDRVAWPTVVGAFGEPADVDGNGRVLILYTRAVNELTEPNSDALIGGFFFARDLFPRRERPVLGRNLGACATSNEAEMFYMLVPDPEGVVNDNDRKKADVRRTTVNTLTHELQHLVNASRRLFVNNATIFEETWLDEGLSHIAEELAFFREGGVSGGINLTIEDLRASQARLNAVDTYGIQNLARLSNYLREPQVHSPLNVDDKLATRGSAWQLLRFLADQPGRDAGAFFRALGNSTSSGVDNLATSLAEPFLPLIRNWAVGTHIDDAAPGIPDRYRHRSWNFRSVLPALPSNEGRYPLQVQDLAAGVERSVSVLAGSAAHFRFVAAGEAPVRLSFALGGGTSAGTCEAVETVALGVGQVRELDVADTKAACFSGPVGAEYAVVAFHNAAPPPRSSNGGARPPLANLVVAVRADGVVAPPGPAGNALAARPALLQVDRLPREQPSRRDVKMRLREIERRELTPLIRGGTYAPPPAYLRVAADSAPLQVTVARLR